jgi:dihydrofolate reductase
VSPLNAFLDIPIKATTSPIGHLVSGQHRHHRPQNFPPTNRLNVYQQQQQQQQQQPHAPKTNMADEIVDQLSEIESRLRGVTSRFDRMRENLEARIESPEIKKYIQQGASCEQTTKSDFFVIAAACKNNGIGLNNKLPWRLKKEMEHFNKMTTTSPDATHKNIVIMGRKTWSSIPPKYRPLQDRTNVVLSRTVSTIEDRESVDHIFSSLPDALEGVSQLRNKGQVWIVGGQSIYEEALRLPQCKRIYLTRIDKEYECDTFFPEIDENIYKLTDDPDVPSEEQEEDGVKYKIYVYERV